MKCRHCSAELGLAVLAHVPDLNDCRVRIVAPDRLLVERPAVTVILSWSIRDEMTEQLQAMRAWGARFLVAVPRLELW